MERSKRSEVAQLVAKVTESFAHKYKNVKTLCNFAGQPWSFRRHYQLEKLGEKKPLFNYE
jgi:hypothetical protein